MFTIQLMNKINVTYSHQLSTINLFGIISLRLTGERIANCLYIKYSISISMLQNLNKQLFASQIDRPKKLNKAY